MISVIVPAYNVQDYLRECIQSVIDQTFADWELILVDDGSTDKTLAVAESFADGDSRIRVLPCTHSHTWAARNHGLDHTHGEYVTFLDADDLLHPAALKTLYEAALDYNATTVLAGHFERSLPPGNVLTPSPLRVAPNRVMGPKTALRAYIKGDLRVAVWASLSRRELFQTLRFSERSCVEDVFFTPQLLAESSRIVAIAPCLYEYRRRPGSITYELSPGQIHRITGWIELYGMCRALYPHGKLRAQAIANIMYSTWFFALWVTAHGTDISIWQRRIHTILPRARLLLFWCNPLLSPRTRINGFTLLLGLRWNAWAYHRLRSVYHLLGRGQDR